MYKNNTFTSISCVSLFYYFYSVITSQLQFWDCCLAQLRESNKQCCM